MKNKNGIDIRQIFGRPPPFVIPFNKLALVAGRMKMALDKSF
jgi:hypothetical protein